MEGEGHSGFCIWNKDPVCSTGEKTEEGAVANCYIISRLIIIIILRQVYLDRSLFDSDSPLHLSNAIVTTAILLHCSLMVATIPCLKPFVVAFNTGWGQGVTNSNGQNSYYTPTGKSGSTGQSRAYATTQTEEDEIDLTVARQSHDSHHSQNLIIHQTREWTVEEEYQMHPVKDRV